MRVWAPNDVDLYIPHQANLRIVEAASRLMRVPMDKFYMNIQRYGNTSAASIPIALTEAIEEGKAKPGDTLGFVAFGAGLTWGSAIVHLGGPDPNQAVSLADELFVLARAKYFARRAAGALARCSDKRNDGSHGSTTLIKKPLISENIRAALHRAAVRFSSFTLIFLSYGLNCTSCHASNRSRNRSR